jgi:hypothetical protein
MREEIFNTPIVLIPLSGLVICRVLRMAADANSRCQIAAHPSSRGYTAHATQVASIEPRPNGPYLVNGIADCRSDTGTSSARFGLARPSSCAQSWVADVGLAVQMVDIGLKALGPALRDGLPPRAATRRLCEPALPAGPWPLKGGKYAGRSLPQILFLDPDYFFWAVEKKVFQGRLAA